MLVPADCVPLPPDALDALLTRAVLPRATHAAADAAADALLTPPVAALFASFAEPLRAVFHAVCSSAALPTRPKSWDEVRPVPQGPALAEH
jgi:hypothetical protein